MKKSVLLAVLMLSACGTVLSGSNQNIRFDSNLKGVRIFVDGMEICKTPCVYPLERKSGSVVVVAKKKGYEDKQIILRSGLNGASVLNLVFWPCWLTDVATGGIWQYSHNGFYVEMEKGDLASRTPSFFQKASFRQYALSNFGALKLDAATNRITSENFIALEVLNKLPSAQLQKIVNDSVSPVNLVENLEEAIKNL